MAIIAPVKDGSILDISATTNTESSSSTNSQDSLDKEAFLSLLVAQMQYQDPLEPTSNTEYISQFATFSQLEATQNLQSTVTQQFGSDLVGKYVIMKVTSNVTGETTMKTGKVDYVTYENDKTYLYINGKPYSIDDLDTVVTEEYMQAVLDQSNVTQKSSDASQDGTDAADSERKAESVKKDEKTQESKAEESKSTDEESSETEKVEAENV